MNQSEVIISVEEPEPEPPAQLNEVLPLLGMLASAFAVTLLAICIIVAIGKRIKFKKHADDENTPPAAQ